MSISSEISRISGNVSDALTAIANKGVTVPSGSNSDDLADLIGQISGGGGGTTWETVYNGQLTISSTDDGSYFYSTVQYNGAIELNSVWKITWNGIPYECTATSIGDPAGIPYAIGNDTIIHEQGGDDEPFFIQRIFTNDDIFVFTSQSQTVNLVIEKQVSGGGGSTLITKTITANGTYDAEDDDADGYSAVTVAIPNGTAGTPTATKGTVSNHSVSVTPSVTNTAGVISGGTITGTAVTVSASELASGNKDIVSNGTNIDVVGYSTVSVAVPSSTGKNVQVEHGTKRIAATAYTDVGYEITVAKTGTYNAYWAGWRSSTSGTNGAQLYVNGQESGSAVTSFDANWTNVQNGSITSVSLTQGDKVTLRARSRNTSYYMYIFFLAIEEV